MRTRISLATVAVLACLATPAGADAHRTTMVCVNPTSGATWEVRIDFDHATVDANPAHVTDASITWRDGKDGGNYTLDRSTGALSAVFASSTGGYFLHDRCAPKYAR
jgi:hypothetical protein